MLLLNLIAISLMMSSSTAWNILVIAPFPSYNRWLYIDNIIDGLLQVGHTVSSITPYPRVSTVPVEKYFENQIEEFPLHNYCEFYHPHPLGKIRKFLLIFQSRLKTFLRENSKVTSLTLKQCIKLAWQCLSSF